MKSLLPNLSLGSAFFVCLTAAPAAPTDPASLEFFEKEIRPLLANHCYECHSAETATPFAGLRLDRREDLIKGGVSGPAVVAGKPEESSLIQRIQGRPALMPPTGALSDAQIQSLIEWVKMGAPWPDIEQASEAPADGFDLEARKRSHWAWQPVRSVPPPAVADTDWPRQPMDRFILARLEQEGLEPATAADRYTLIRRLSYDLRGLPPLPGEVRAFVSDPSPRTYVNLVDDFLDSPHFGEHWARHWMDVIRYAESHGSQGDPKAPYAWRYRDYLIRALNADVPYDQLIREHLAGDLLPSPRMNPALGINESLLATAHFRMVEHGFQPVDPLGDRIKWTDNQVDVVSKAFQGLTISCARCHDHKFDAISQDDYYALYGVLYGARPTQRAIDDPERLDWGRGQLSELKEEIRLKLAEIWIQEASALTSTLLEAPQEAFNKSGDSPCETETSPESAADPAAPEAEAAPVETDGDKAAEVPVAEQALNRALKETRCEPGSPLAAWIRLAGKNGAEFRQEWGALKEEWDNRVRTGRGFNREQFQVRWDLSGPGYGEWIGHGTGLPPEPSPPGEFSVAAEGKRILSGIYPGGVYTHLLSAKHNGVIQSPRFTIDSNFISLSVLGSDFSFAQLIVENYAAPRGGIYHMRHVLKTDRMEWVQWDVAYWKGFSAYIELATRDDVTLVRYDSAETRTKAEKLTDGRSAIGASRILFHKTKETPRETRPPLLYLLRGLPPRSPADLAERLGRRLVEAVEAWRDGGASESQAAYLDAFVRADLLSRSLDRLPSLGSLLAQYREVESKVPVPRRAPSILDEAAPDHPFLVRGDQDAHGERVPRRYLTALDSLPYPDPERVRLGLARDLTASDNPLTSRVMVNRIWRYLFGYGLVRTTDNFGKLGEPPTHPKLLDHLAHRFMQEGSSIKSMVRRLVTSRTYRMSSQGSAKALRKDPANRLHQHANLRRLEAEEIRDAMLRISGSLDPTLYGPSIPIQRKTEKDKSTGLGPSGSPDGSERRSIYQEIRRNAYNSFLETFGQPKPASTRGQRDQTNDPAQSLTLLNSPFAWHQAESWGKHLAGGESITVSSRIHHMFFKALGREPTAQEASHLEGYLDTVIEQRKTRQHLVLTDRGVWADLAHVIFNLKSFIYLQ
ncbi:MAG: PSD1 and planctomycete cytochrome C domain-containing protein [Acidobacteriota bacterium]|nr:PSD1 and planctomycete cytochrome C domain-containing protein [Acidobacteriota bacterium]